MPQVLEYLKKTNRFLIEDPAPKYPFLAEKKKSKKEKEPKKDETKKEQKP